MLLKACINGNRDPGAHLALPVTPEQIAAAARTVRDAGAGAVHVHPKAPDGRDSIDADSVTSAVAACRSSGLPVGVTTGAWIQADPARRVEAVRNWTVSPDFASVNWNEAGADDVAEALLARGIGVEAGLFHEEAVAAWTRWRGHRDACLRILIELGEDDDTAVADRLTELVRSTRTSAPILLHGADRSCWPILRHAMKTGLDTRVGLEDTLQLPDDSLAPDNAALIRAALAFR